MPPAATSAWPTDGDPELPGPLVSMETPLLLDDSVAPGPSRRGRQRRWVRWTRTAVAVVLLGLGVAAAYGRRHDLQRGVEQLGRPSWLWLGCACLAQASSMVAFARMQRSLLRCGGIRVRLRHMVEITLAGNALSTSVPGGAAWAGGWVWGQLRRRHVDRVLASWVVLVAGALSAFALFLLVVVGAFIAGSEGPVASLRWLAGGLLGFVALGAAAGVALVRSPSLNARWASAVAGAAVAATHGGEGRRMRAVRPLVIRYMDRFIRQVLAVSPSPRAWAGGVVLALYNWTAELFALVFVVWTVHGHVPWRGIVVVYALTQLSAILPITPGGLAVVEASMTALLTAYGMDASTAITVVLLYRLVTFWALVPIGWGSWAYVETAGQTSRRRQRWSVRRGEMPVRPV